MNFLRLILTACLVSAGTTGYARTAADTVAILHSGQDCSIRGMSIPADGIIWLSGSNGHVARSTDTGRTWIWTTVPGFERTDFRDIHAFDSASAVIMGIGNPAYLLKTRDGGRSWKPVFTKSMEGMFLDAMDFRDDAEGICIGDPVDDGSGRKSFFVIRTKDGGDTWAEDRSARTPAGAGEAVFSASGTNIALLNRRDFDYAFISGGLASNLYLIGRNGRSGKVYPLPVLKGRESSGAFSMSTDGRKKFFVIGGDYKVPDSVQSNFAWTTDKGKNWKAAVRPPYGYRSCIRIIDSRRMVACGTNGVDICSSPRAWKRISKEGFNVCMVSPGKKLIFFGGAKGRIGWLRL